MVYLYVFDWVMSKCLFLCVEVSVADCILSELTVLQYVYIYLNIWLIMIKYEVEFCISERTPRN